jgi:tetratricopeptide (TPR) repeat protein
LPGPIFRFGRMKGGAMQRIDETKPRLLKTAREAFEAGDQAGAKKHLCRLLQHDPNNVEANIGLGEIALAEGDYKEALDQFIVALKNAPHDLDIARWIPRILEQGGDQQSTTAEQIAEQTPESTALLFVLIERAVETGDTGVADRWLARLEQLRPTAAEGWVNIGRAHQWHNELQAARLDYDHAIKLASTWAYPYLLRGDVLFNLSEDEAAIRDFTRASELSPEDSYAYCRIGDVYRLLGNKAKAVERYQQAVGKNPQDALAYYGMGLVLQALGQFDDALRAFERVVELKPTSPIGHQNVGNVQVALDDHEAALAAYGKAIDLAPDQPDSYLLRGDVYTKQKQFAQAEQDFKRAIELASQNPRGYYALGDLYLGKGDLEQALKAYSDPLKLNPDDAGAYYGRGLVYERQEQYEQALQEYERAATLAPALTVAHLSVAEMSRLLGQNEKALEHYREVLKVDSRNLEALNGIGLVYWAQGRFSDALRQFDRSLKLDSEQIQVHLWRGQVREAQGKYDQALQEYKLILERDKTNLEAWDCQGQTYYAKATLEDRQSQVYKAKADFEQALKAYQQIIRLAPKDARGYLGRGDVYLANGAYEQALLDYDRVVELTPDSPSGYYGRALVYEAQEGYREAIAEYTEIIQRSSGLVSSDIAWAYLARGKRYLDLNDSHSARADLEKAVKFDLENVDAHYFLGLALENQKDYTGALREYDEVTRLMPDDSYGHDARGNALIGLKAYDRAVIAFDQAIKLEQKNSYYLCDKADALRLWGDTLNDLDKLQQGSIIVDEATKLKQDDQVAYAVKGAALCSLKRYDEAISELDKALELDPYYGFALWHKTRALLGKGQAEQAIKVVQDLSHVGEDYLPKASAGELLALRQLGRNQVEGTIPVSSKSDNSMRARAYLDRAMALEDLDAAVDAIADCRKAVELQSDWSEAHNLLAWIQADKIVTNLEEATEEAETAVKLAEGKAKAEKADRGNYLDTLGWVWYKRGNLIEALRYLKQAVELAEPDLLIRKHLEQVEKDMSEAG